MKTNEKPTCDLTGVDGNVFAIVGAVKRTLMEADKAVEAKAMCARVWTSGSYAEALAVMGEYVEIEMEG